VNRRLLLLAAPILAVVTVSACSTFQSGIAAKVNGTEIDDEAVEFVLHASPDTIETSYVKAGSARAVLSQLVKAQIAQDLATSLGADLTSARATARTQIEQALDEDSLAEWKDLTEDSQNLVLDASGATSTALANAHATPPSNLEELYADPEQTGFMCLRYMTFEKIEDAEATKAQLDTGAVFADLANQLSPNANGGILSPGGQSECVSMDSVIGAGPQISSALLASSPGAPTEIVSITNPDSPTGQLHYIFLHRPYAEIADQLQSAVAGAPQFAALQGAYSSADIHVASKYGKWDEVTQAIIPMG